MKSLHDVLLLLHDGDLPSAVKAACDVVAEGDVILKESGEEISKSESQCEVDSSQQKLYYLFASHLYSYLLKQLDNGYHPGEQLYEGNADGFQYFIEGGGNIPLYLSVSSSLAEFYTSYLQNKSNSNEENSNEEFRILDIGVGNGRALCASLIQLNHKAIHVDLIEPSSSLLSLCQKNLLAIPSLTSITAHNCTANHFLTQKESENKWDIIQSSFCLQTLTPTDRKCLFQSFLHKTKAFLIIEFDIAEIAMASQHPSTQLHLHRYHHILTKYLNGFAEYTESPHLTTIAEGFLIPAFLSAFNANQKRTNFEQNSHKWCEELREVGYDVRVIALYEYWWAPAFLLIATC
jgi:hypothetical protein